MDLGFLAHSTWGWVYAWVFLTAFLCALAATPLVGWYARKIGFLDVPNQRASHVIPTPLGGGAAIALGFLASVHVGIFLAGSSDASLPLIIFGGLVVLTLGLVDDFSGGIPATFKLAILFALTVILWQMDSRLVIKITPWVWFNVLLTLLWIVGVTSAINAIDNMNGLSVGFVAIAALAYFAVAIETLTDRENFTLLNRFWALVSLALCGSCLGFLPHNFPRGRIFIGDGGSFFLGFNLAVLGVMGEWSHLSSARATIPLLVLALPIFDLAFTVFTRHRDGVTRTLGEAIRHCARDHLSHRLVDAGLSKVQAVLVLHAVAGVLALSAVEVAKSDTLSSTLLHLAQAAIVLVILAILIKVGGRREGPPRDTRAAESTPHGPD